MFSRIAVFYVLAWFFLLLLAVIQQATGLLPPEIGLAQWGPGIAALVMLVIFRKDRHKISFFSRDIPVMRYVYAAVIPICVGVIVFLIRLLISIEPTAAAPNYGSVLAMVAWMPVGAIGEELGWRGYLHKKLDLRMRGLDSSLLVGILWMPIHVTFYAQGPIFLFFLALLIISYSVVIYALVNDTGFNVLLAGVFHVFVNICNLPFLDVINQTRFMMVNALVWITVAGVIVFMKREVFFSARRTP